MGQNKLVKFFTPDFILLLVILVVSVQFAGEFPVWFDIPQSDDNVYMFGGTHFLDFFRNPDMRLAPDWSPLYQFWYFVIYRFVPDSAQIYYVSMSLVGVLIPFFTFLLLRKMHVTPWLAVATAAFFIASYAIWMVEPRVTSFTALVLLFVWWAVSFLKEHWQRFFGMAAGSLCLAYSRPEFFLVTLAFVLIAFTYLGFSMFKHEKKLARPDFWFLGLSCGIPLLFLIWWGVPFSGERWIYAFGQHYAKNVQFCFQEEGASNLAWEEILARDFDNARSMEDVVRANPLNFRRHLVCNLQSFPGRFLKVAFGSAWGNSWLIIRLLAAFVIFRLIVSWDAIKRQIFWLWDQDFLLLGVFSLGILLIDIIFIYPREHYLSIFSIIIWVLGISLVGDFFVPEHRSWRQSIAIGSCLLLLMPSMGVLFNFEVPQKPVLKTVETVRAQEITGPIRLFATRPFRRSQSEVYFDDNYYHIGYKPAGIPFVDYITEQRANVIVITQGGMDLQDDSSWLEFEANPQGFGFYQIPFSEGDQWGPWRIYRKN